MLSPRAPKMKPPVPIQAWSNLSTGSYASATRGHGRYDPEFRDPSVSNCVSRWHGRGCTSPQDRGTSAALDDLPGSGGFFFTELTKRERNGRGWRRNIGYTMPASPIFFTCTRLSLAAAKPCAFTGSVRAGGAAIAIAAGGSRISSTGEA